jgi:hypothetical protein
MAASEAVLGLFAANKPTLTMPLPVWTETI